MLSIYRDSSGKTLLDVTDCESVKEVKTVKMMNLGLTDFDQQMFSQMKNIEEMDISGNKLDTIPDYISLPKLKRLNCSRNRFSDITFVQQFPNLEEMDIRQNKISFSDHCIACDLCPRLRRINNQDFNIEQLKEKLENRLKPLIQRVWLEHFMSTFDDRMSMEEFEAIGEKFRTMLKHSNIPVTKVVMKFKDFKLMQLIDRFLTAIRDSSEGSLFGVSNCTTERSKKSYASKKSAQSGESDIDLMQLPSTEDPGETSAATEASDPQMQDNTVYVLTSDKEAFSMDSDTVYILAEGCDEADLSNVVILTENGQITENGKKALQAIWDKDGAVSETQSEPTPTATEEGSQVEGRVTKFVPGPISWNNPQQEVKTLPVSSSTPTEAASAPRKQPQPPPAPNILSQKTTAASKAKPKAVKSFFAEESDVAPPPKVVKYWLYDEEIKPLRKAKKPDVKKRSKRLDLSQYIVGPATEFSMANRRAMAAESASANVPEAPEAPDATDLPESPSDAATASVQEPADANLSDNAVDVEPDKTVSTVDTCEVNEEVVLFDLESEAIYCDDPEETADDPEEETNHVKEATLLLDLSQSRPALPPAAVAEQEIASSEVIDAAPEVTDAAPAEESSAACPEKVIRIREDPDKGLRVPPKKRVRFLDEVQAETLEDDDGAVPEGGATEVDVADSELTRPSTATEEET